MIIIYTELYPCQIRIIYLQTFMWFQVFLSTSHPMMWYETFQAIFWVQVTTSYDNPLKLIIVSGSYSEYDDFVHGHMISRIPISFWLF